MLALAAVAATMTVSGTSAVVTTSAAATTRSAAAADDVRALTAADEHVSDTALAVENHPAFGGIRLTPDHSTIEVYVTRHDARLEAAARAAAKDAPLRFTLVKHSYTTLKALQRRIVGDRHSLRARGVQVVAVGVKDSQNSVFVRVDKLTSAKAAAVRSTYRGLPVTVQDGVATTAAASRLDDAAPWNGGDFISGDGTGNDCSAGGAVKNSAGHRYLLTAGHCFRQSGSSGFVYRVFQGSEHYTSDDPVMIGYAKAENPGPGEVGYDLAVIDPDDGVSGIVWKSSTPFQTTGKGDQKGTFRAAENTVVCASGAFSGQRCNGEITAFDIDILDGSDGGVTMHVNEASNLGGAAMAGPGDSGGPVYQQRTDTDIYIAGTILAIRANASTPCPNNVMEVGTRGNNCDYVVYFQGIGSTLGHLGLSIVVR
ncbi:MAG TPA: trypsin-like serine protease [Frankiaceae bacterium]|jgi:hypothetical protein|nr:trypsin-like serine protease [Frankiaceae bacterium]